MGGGGSLQPYHDFLLFTEILIHSENCVSLHPKQTGFFLFSLKAGNKPVLIFYHYVFHKYVH